jgi:hypothetical protein
MAVYGPGDAVPIRTTLDDGTRLADQFVVTYFDPDRCLLFTCGHCFPSNASLQRADGELVATTGYMDACRDEGVEVAVVRIWNTFRFRPQLRNGALLTVDERPVPPGTGVCLFCGDVQLDGTLLGQLAGGRVSHGGVIYRVQDMPRVNEPCHVVCGRAGCSEYASCLLTSHGFSGSPWAVRADADRFRLVGSHVAKVVLLTDAGVRLQASLAVPVERMLRMAPP